jgi:hypothetical protein
MMFAIGEFVGALLITFGLACAVWLVIDMVRYRRRAVERERGEVEQAERERLAPADGG